MDEEINYKTLRKIQETEKNSPILSEIKSDFYSAFMGYFKNLIKRLDLEKSSQKRLLLSDEIENTKKIGKSIYEYREKKILLAAISKARGGSPDLKNIINDEKILFDSVYELILKSRKNTINIEKLDEGEVEIKTDQLKEILPEKNKPEVKQENTNPIIKITEDIPEFIGTDGKKYSLKKNDIISLQEDMSNMLIKRKVAEKINW